MRLSNVNATYFFDNTSIDYNGLGGTGSPDSSNLTVLAVFQASFTDCHIETSTSPIKFGLRSAANYKVTFNGSAIVFVASLGATPCIDIDNGAFVTMIGNNAVFNNSTKTPIKVRAGGGLMNIDNILSFGGSPIVTDRGSRYNSFQTVVVS
jgi:hypothetical protein